MGTFARWCLRHRKLVLASWLVALGTLVVVGFGVGASYASDFQLPSTESTHALKLLEKTFPEQSGEADHIVFRVDEGTVRDPAVRARMIGVFDRLRQVPHVTGVVSPYEPNGRGQVSRDGRIAFATVGFQGIGQRVNSDSVNRVISIAESARRPGLQVELGGDAIQDSERKGNLGTTELLGLLAAAVILFIAFGSLLAMALPLITAVVAIGSALGVVVLLTHVFRVADFAPELTALLGLGVGIDYALFIVTRYRQNIQAGMSSDDAIATAVNTSGRAVLFAGITVCISVLGMFALGVNFLYGLAVCTAVGVASTMIAALTFLPALLGVLGRHVLSRREQRRLAAEGPHEPELSGLWGSWARRVQRHRLLAVALSTGVLVVLALPFFAMRLGVTDEGNDAKDTTTRKAYDLLADGFGPGFNGPLQVALDVSKPGAKAAVPRLMAALRHEPGVAAVNRPITAPGGKTTVINLYPTSAPQDKETTDLLHHLRNSVVPGATEGTGAVGYIGGVTAIFNDFASVIAHKLPQFVGVVLGLSFLLLMTVFRSIVVPLKAAALNLLSIGAGFGVVVAVFQWGWFGSLFGVTRTGPIVAFLPVMVFAILFGLSMDYEVFLVSRMHEEWTRTTDNTEAVNRGLAATGRVITAAAAIMIVIFSSFALAGEVTITLFGVAFAATVFIDAFIIRTVLVPAFMQLMGSANWWLPGWLDRFLPDVHLEAEDLHEHPLPEAVAAASD